MCHVRHLREGEYTRSSGRYSHSMSGFPQRRGTQSALHPRHQSVYALSPEPPFGMEAVMKSRLLIAVGAVVLTVVGMTIAQQPKIGLTPAGGAGAVPPTY